MKTPEEVKAQILAAYKDKGLTPVCERFGLYLRTSQEERFYDAASKCCCVLGAVLVGEPAGADDDAYYVQAARVIGISNTDAFCLMRAFDGYVPQQNDSPAFTRLGFDLRKELLGLDLSTEQEP